MGPGGGAPIFAGAGGPSADLGLASAALASAALATTNAGGDLVFVGNCGGGPGGGGGGKPSSPYSSSLASI